MIDHHIVVVAAGLDVLHVRTILSVWSIGRCQNGVFSIKHGSYTAVCLWRTHRITNVAHWVVASAHGVVVVVKGQHEDQWH